MPKKSLRGCLLRGTGPQPTLQDDIRKMTFRKDCKQIVQSGKLLKAAILERKSAEKDLQRQKPHVDTSECATSQHEVKFHSQLKDTSDRHLSITGIQPLA